MKHAHALPGIGQSDAETLEGRSALLAVAVGPWQGWSVSVSLTMHGPFSPPSSRLGPPLRMQKKNGEGAVKVGNNPHPPQYPGRGFGSFAQEFRDADDDGAA